MAATRRFFWVILLSSVLGGSIGVGLYRWFFVPVQPTVFTGAVAALPVSYYSSYRTDTVQRSLAQGLSFVDAARSTIPSVVHIRVRKELDYSTYFQRFFSQESTGDGLHITGAGSGVIVSSEGYVVTNYHVIEDADQIEVVLSDNRAFEAELVGTDPSTDLALLRIQATDLWAIPMGDSDQLEIGAWVLAVGNPFELRSTVTAGIVSAKARNISAARHAGGLDVEAFIQTDAVVNRGNSGGALVNLAGELVGINTAIFTETGAYEGYSFAVPVTLVKKVTEDLRIYGHVQRALLGIRIIDVDAHLAKKKKFSFTRGVFVVSIAEGSAAAAAGLEIEDVITAVNGNEVLNTPQLQEKIARKRPGDKVQLSIIRNDIAHTLEVTLQSPSETP